ncbi:hypothetical protein BJ322DRAFT_1113551 [Thelephora terrestris]|uniref:Uncharacterized protein n=1 Tax=Thelephora terrestris TaxID=56493 RepID=A0A9P6H4Q5_9AGAM|nr:hypothetical protein BJ322DRAFT_1113551 [Thelephora terrestris]
MAEGFRTFTFPVLLALPSSSDEKYRFLLSAYFEYAPSERAKVSGLEEAALAAVRLSARRLKIASDSTMSVGIYQLCEPRPLEGSLKDMKNAYSIINEDYMEKKATYLSHLRSLNGVKSDNVIAVLTVMHEVNQSEAQIRREGIAAAAQKRESPSTGASLTQRTLTQNDGRADAVYNYRPAELTPPPITIYHPVFAKFLQLMAEPPDPTHEELGRAHEFVCLASAYYRDEAERVGKLSRSINAAVHDGILGTHPLSYTSSKLAPGGVVFSGKTPSGFLTIAAILVLEAKAEIGEAVYSSDEARHIREASCCPALIIGMPGPNIIVSGAVFADKIITQTLTDYISVIPRPNRNNRSPFDDAGYRIAHLFCALKECINNLEVGF